MKPYEVNGAMNRSVALDGTLHNLLAPLQARIRKLLYGISPTGRRFEYGNFNYDPSKCERICKAVGRHSLMAHTPANLEAIAQVDHLIPYVDRCQGLVKYVYRLAFNSSNDFVVGYCMLPSALKPYMGVPLVYSTAEYPQVTDLCNKLWERNSVVLQELKEMIVTLRLLS